MDKRKKMMAIVLVVGVLFALCGCKMINEERVKLKDLGFSVLSEEVIPEELKK